MYCRMNQSFMLWRPVHTLLENRNRRLPRGGEVWVTPEEEAGLCEEEWNCRQSKQCLQRHQCRRDLVLFRNLRHTAVLQSHKDVPQETGPWWRSNEILWDDSRCWGGKENYELDVKVFHERGTAQRVVRAQDGDRRRAGYSELHCCVIEDQHLIWDGVGECPPWLKVSVHWRQGAWRQHFRKRMKM